MDIINNKNLDSCLIATNKSENHRGYIELLYESKKRTGGDEIINLIHDPLLKQFIIIFKNNTTTSDVLANGDVSFDNELYQTYRIDRTKLIIENIDSNLRNDVINLYIDYLFEGTENCQFKINQLKPGYVLVECSHAIDFDLLAKKYSKHTTLQNKIIKYHFVPELDKDLNSLNKVDRIKYFSNILNICSELRCDSQIVGYAESNQEILSASEIFYREKIKNLEHKLLLCQNLNKINFFDDKPNNLAMNGACSYLSTNDNSTLITSCYNDANLVPKECKLVYQDSNRDELLNMAPETSKNRCDKTKLSRSFQKFLIEDNRTDEETAKKNDSCSTAKISNKIIMKKPQCSFFPLKLKCSQLAQKFPVIKYQRPKCKSYFQPEEETGENPELDTCLNLNIKCSICLDDLLPNENVKILSCFHQFHVKCIDTWLAQKSTCPTCKLDLINSSNE